jgi:hypothetical protein
MSYMLGVAIKSIMLNVNMLSVIMLNVVALFQKFQIVASNQNQFKPPIKTFTTIDLEACVIKFFYIM